ncbi:fimbrial protein [Cupriavidus sp. USMAHM13]|uniref:fimbrial protein n=1 Tax=Cupriavidus sp. USMAHM13 TaxID=1389192 RepID=UPI0012EA9B41|nr:hypothetical protein [Cupriavidus sp. USMAHM13]
MTRNSPAWTQRPRRRRARALAGAFRLLLLLLPASVAAASYNGAMRCSVPLPPSGDGGWSGTGLTAAAKPGDVLLKRTVSFFVRFETKRTQSPQVLAALGNWINPVQLVNTDIMPVVLANDPTPFVSKIGIRMSHKDQAIYRGPQQQTILNVKELATEDTNYAFDLFQELVLLVDPKELPAGDIKIAGIAKGAMVELFTYSVDASKGIVGQTVAPHAEVNACNSNLATGKLMNALIPRETIPNRCKVEVTTIPVTMKNYSLLNVAEPAWEDPGSDPFTLKLSDCAQNAKPQIWFRDENEPGNTSDTLSVSGGAGGIGIAMFSLPTGKPARRVKYFSSAPPAGSSGHHAMEVNGTEATLKFFARYVRTGEPLAAGDANGLASYFITFP